MTLTSVDINADLGESYGNWVMGDDEELLTAITTANVACGFHASDPVTMALTVERARGLGVAVGAHPGLPDLLGFGRRRLDVTLDEARAYVLYQIGALRAFVESAGLTLHHVKPHGALYWMINEEDALARVVAGAIAEVHPNGLYYWPAPVPAGVRRSCEGAGLRVVGEVYFDTRYADDGSLLIERKKGSIDIDAAINRLRRFVSDGMMETATGARIKLDGESICVHGDSPNATELARRIRQTLDDEGVSVRAVESGH